jgi:hypothetical protein
MQKTSMVGEEAPYIFCSPTSFFEVRLNPTISPSHIEPNSSITYNPCGLPKTLSRPRVQLSSHNHPCDPLETFTGSPFTM